jgi:hypothetical protein
MEDECSENYKKTRTYLKVQPWTRMLGIMNIAAYAGRKFRKIPLINKRAIGMGTIGFVLNVTTNILAHKKTANLATLQPVIPLLLSNRFKSREFEPNQLFASLLTVHWQMQKGRKIGLLTD